MKFLFTGFEPFGKESINPAYEAVKRIPNTVAGAEIVKLEIPTVFTKAGQAVEKGILEYNPDVVICIGQAGGDADIQVERVAINLIEASIPDNAGNQPIDTKCQKDGPNAYFATIPVKAIVDNIRDSKIPTRISYSAGSFVCNNVMYDLLHMIDKKYPNIRGGFIHVPFVLSQGVDKPSGTPTMAIETMVAALECAIETIVKEQNT